VGDAGDVVSATDGQDRGEAGPGGSGRGAREKGVSEAGHRRGTDTWARVARFEPDLKQNPNSNGSKIIQTISKFCRLERYRCLEKLK
jgi:hypothetical protein